MSDNKWWQFGARRQGQEQHPSQLPASGVDTERQSTTRADVAAPTAAPSPAESFVSVTLTAAEAATVTTALQEHTARHTEAAEPSAFSPEYDYEEVRDAVAAAQQQSALSGGVSERLVAAVAEHVPAQAAPTLDPETDRAVGVGPNGEVGAGYVETPEADDTNAVVPLELSAPETEMLRDALDRYSRDAESTRDRQPDLDLGEVDIEYDQLLDARLERAGRVAEKVDEAVMARTADASAAAPQPKAEAPLRRSSSFPRSANETLTTERPALSTGGGSAGVQAPFRSEQPHVSSHPLER